jgi:hypothetical protein
VREARTSGAAASSDAEKIAGRIVEYGTAAEAANWSMLWWARWLIPSEPAEALSTERRVTCSIEEIPAAALIVLCCRTPSVPVEPIAMNTVPIPSSASVRSRGSSRRVGPMRSPPGFAEGAAGFAGVTDERGDRITAREHAADDLTADTAGRADHSGGHRASLR